MLKKEISWIICVFVNVLFIAAIKYLRVKYKEELYFSYPRISDIFSSLLFANVDVKAKKSCLCKKEKAMFTSLSLTLKCFGSWSTSFTRLQLCVILRYIVLFGLFQFGRSFVGDE